MASQPLQITTYRQEQTNYASHLDGIEIPQPIEPENQLELKIASTKSLQKAVNRIADENRQAFNSIKAAEARINEQLIDCEKMLRSSIQSENLFRTSSGQQLLDCCQEVSALEQRLMELE